MRRVEPERVLALGNMATLANRGGALTIPFASPHDRSRGLEEERRRISRELHDGVAQELQAIVMHLRLALAASSPIATCVATTTALAIAERGLGMTRSLLADLHGYARSGNAPTQSLARGLSDSLREATRYSIIELQMKLDQSVRISHAVYGELTQMVREIAINTIKHANATTITCVTKQLVPGTSWQVDIRDDGVGFNTISTELGFGIRGLHERAGRMGGTISIASATGQGTLVQLTFPTA